MFRATCDVCGKDDGDDTYYAWADANQATGAWDDAGCGIRLDDGRLFCFECVPPDVCQFSDNNDGKHTPSADGLTCDECDVKLPARAEHTE